MHLRSLREEDEKGEHIEKIVHTQSYVRQNMDSERGRSVIFLCQRTMKP